MTLPNTKGESLMSNALARIDFDKEQMAVIESQFFPTGASKAEQQYCFSVARELCLNPITKEIFFVSRRQKINDKWVNKVEPMVGRDGFLSIAHRTNQFAGIETTAGIREVPQLEDGKWRPKHQLVAECTVWRKDSSKPFTAQVAYNEYCQKTAEGNPTKFWLEKPETMLKKVAESQALRKAFNIHGVYCPEEIGAGFELANGEIVTQSIEADCTRIEADKSHLSIVKPPDTKYSKQKTLPLPQEPKPVPSTPPLPDEDDGWPDLPPPRVKVIDEVALQVLDLLDGRNISYDIIMEGIDGIISANSFNEKEVLKSSGFRWSPDQKRWIYKFKNEPF
jgi:phage recombination protein Bet